ncbi:hypothetical protein JZ751_012527 [Albula glossodonta]|uniref:Uncharacterized protein n=1 Tax=Albula glossodonta TaxID=121402 RepID=A0A8T2NXJ4_9TELE|nr:hypothetical protein JZ751_012527 [Albula glossodonta]
MLPYPGLPQPQPPSTVSATGTSCGVGGARASPCQSVTRWQFLSRGVESASSGAALFTVYTQPFSNSEGLQVSSVSCGQKKHWLSATNVTLTVTQPLSIKAFLLHRMKACRRENRQNS